MSRTRVRRNRRGARIFQGDAVLSEILSSPGPAHRFVDVIAACVAAFAPGPRFLMLGFAGGGVVGPLRAARWAHPVHAVDLSRHGEAIFRELCGGWAGEVSLEVGEAAAWLNSHRASWDLILDDLSIDSPAGVTKPSVSVESLPGGAAARLGRDGVYVCNLLPVPGRSWAELLTAVAAPWGHAVAVEAREWENRLVVAGATVPDARTAGRRLRHTLATIGSRMATEVALRTVVLPGDAQRDDGSSR